MIYAPIALFVYSRPQHTRLTVEALLKNLGAEHSDLIIFSDDAKSPDKSESVKEVRTYLKTILGFKSITIHHRSRNYGLAKSIIEGVTQVLQAYERVIVLEDDLVTSPHFLNYMNLALEKYASNERVISIHGYVYPTPKPLPEAFFLRGADCWGWATWRRGWKLFNPNGQALVDELQAKNLIHEFNFNGASSFSSMLKDQIDGVNDSWAIRWHASAFLHDKLTLHPGRSLVQNIGHDGSGTHCGSDAIYEGVLSANPINLEAISVEESSIARDAFELFYRARQESLIAKIQRRIRKIFNKNI